MAQRRLDRADVDPCCLELDERGADQPNYKPTGFEHYNILLPEHRVCEQPATPTKKRIRKKEPAPALPIPQSLSPDTTTLDQEMGENAVEPPTENKSLCSLVFLEPEVLGNATLETEALDIEAIEAEVAHLLNAEAEAPNPDSMNAIEDISSDPSIRKDSCIDENQAMVSPDDFAAAATSVHHEQKQRE